MLRYYSADYYKIILWPSCGRPIAVRSFTQPSCGACTCHYARFAIYDSRARTLSLARFSRSAARRKTRMRKRGGKAARFAPQLDFRKAHDRQLCFLRDEEIAIAIISLQLLPSQLIHQRSASASTEIDLALDFALHVPPLPCPPSNTCCCLMSGSETSNNSSFT